jgi:hypothetical protein
MRTWQREEYDGTRDAWVRVMLDENWPVYYQQNDTSYVRNWNTWSWRVLARVESDGLCQSNLYLLEHAMVNRHDHTRCPVCDGALDRQTKTEEGYTVSSHAVCGRCCLYEDHFEDGVGDERIGFYRIHGTWQVKPDLSALKAERAAAIADAQTILGRAPIDLLSDLYQGAAATGDRTALLVLADALQENGAAPLAEAQLRATEKYVPCVGAT